MAAKFRFDTIDRTVVLESLAGLGEAQRSANLAALARSELRKAQDINKAAIGYIPDHTTTVDGVDTTNLSAVKPNGTIVFEFAQALQEQVITWIWNLIRQTSPVLTGKYKETNWLFADGNRIMDPKGVVANEWVFLNVQPYARKIEPPRAQSKQAKIGVYSAVAAMARSRYGNLAIIRYVFRTPAALGQTPLEQWAYGHNAKKRLSGRKAEKRLAVNLRQPAILVLFRGRK